MEYCHINQSSAILGELRDHPGLADATVKVHLALRNQLFWEKDNIFLSTVE